MGINVSTAMGFENRDFLHDTAKQILKNDGVKEENSSGNTQRSVDCFVKTKQSDLSVYAASTQITLNNSLKETLKYLKNHAQDKRKQHILGELWGSLTEYSEESYQGELIDLEIDYNFKNIFAA